MNSLSQQRRTAHGHLWMVLGMLCLGIFSTGCKAIVATNNRNWAPDQAKLPISEVNGDHIKIHNVRNCRYATSDNYVVQYYDKDIRLSDIQTVDFVVVPFKDTPSVAHTMLSFGLADGQYLVSSVEIRKEANEEYSAWKGFFNQYELMYVIGDERDVINLSSNYYNSDVYLYRTVAKPEQAQELFLDVVKRANKLAADPEFYNTITNNCTTNIVSHVNKIAPKSVPYDMRILLPGYSDEYAYSLGLLDTSVPFEQLRSESKINQLAHRYRDDENFSQYIRR
ncbi:MULTISPECIES: DUF4105 domain-containing protein [Pirellulaceae]|nr:MULTISPECIES: DUF4105 domain-containing protein [Pirellulaceae]